MTQLTAILLNPPAGPQLGHITKRNLEELHHCLPIDEILTVNLCDAASKDLPGLSQAGIRIDSWRQHRGVIARAVASADLLLFAWGLGGLSGPARAHFEAQVDWLLDHAEQAGHRDALTVGQSPRHPSRWRQYLSPTHGVHLQESFGERLRSSLESRPLRDSVQPVRRSRNRRKGSSSEL